MSATTFNQRVVIKPRTGDLALNVYQSKITTQIPQLPVLIEWKNGIGVVFLKRSSVIAAIQRITEPDQKYHPNIQK
jgi:hypothetical protein